MRTKRGKVTTLFLLVGILMFSLSCAELDTFVRSGSGYEEDPTSQTEEKPPEIVKRFTGQGTHTEVSILGDVSTSCEVPYTVTATIDSKESVFIEGIGACISNYSSCSLSADEQCSLNATGRLSDSNKVSLYRCNIDLAAYDQRISVENTRMSGTFVCTFGESTADTTSLTFDITLVP